MDPPSLNVDNHRRGPPLTVLTNLHRQNRSLSYIGIHTGYASRLQG